MQSTPNQPQDQFPQTPMPPQSQPLVPTQAQADMKAHYLKQAFNAAGSNFYSIAVLSLINSVINFFEGSIYFPVGLGITQIIDAFAQAFGEEVPKAGNVFFGIGVALDLMIFGVVALFGFFIKKQISWLIILGAVLYLLDGILLLVFQDWIGAGFHAYFLYRIWVSWRPISGLLKAQDTQSAIGTL
ncbi:MAG: hypothetical protein HY865_04980 [Chloroflexi bacterium]|nr:hypothetical protein [Chloroflexota bacterium]